LAQHRNRTQALVLVFGNSLNSVSFLFAAPVTVGFLIVVLVLLSADVPTVKELPISYLSIRNQSSLLPSASSAFCVGFGWRFGLPLELVACVLLASSVFAIAEDVLVELVLLATLAIIS